MCVLILAYLTFGADRAASPLAKGFLSTPLLYSGADRKPSASGDDRVDRKPSASGDYGADALLLFSIIMI